jgi:hypothetical protein
MNPLSLDLPDEKDCYVIPAAIKTNANIIVTNDLKHFPRSASGIIRDGGQER